MHQCRPVRGTRQFRMRCNRDALDSFIARHAVYDVDFVDDAAQFARHRAEALVGGRQRGLAHLALGDVDHQAHHAPGLAVGRALHHESAVQRPVPAAVGVAKAIFRLQHLAAESTRCSRRRNWSIARSGSRCRAAGASSWIGAAEHRVHAEHAVIAVGVVGDAVLDVPVPHARGS